MTNACLWALLSLGLSGSPAQATRADLPGSIFLVFVEEHSSAFVSSFGHLYACLPDHEVNTVHDLLYSDALNFGADTSPLGRGMWVGEFKVQPCHELVRSSARFEGRAVYFYELDLNSEEVLLRKSRLTELLAGTFPYDFVRRNCGSYISSWLVRGSGVRFYETPRQSLTFILASLGARRVFYLPSDLEVLRSVLAESRSVDQGLVRRCLRDPDSIEELGDPLLQLALLSVAEVSVAPDEFQAIQAQRERLLSSELGKEAARKLIARRQSMEDSLGQDWLGWSEGPALILGSTSQGLNGAANMRVTAEAGYRDWWSSPRHRSVLRDIHFLRLGLDIGSGSDDNASAVLLSMYTLRDILGLRSGVSSGFSLGYQGRQDYLGRCGAYVDSWLGIGARVGASWGALGVSLVADELQQSPRLRAIPTLGIYIFESSTAVRLGAAYSQSEGISLELEASLGVTSQVSMQLELQSREGVEPVLFLGLQTRF